MKGEKVGYGRPPTKSQFKPGRSGNPKGRPKGSSNLATDLSTELGELISVREAGRTRRISKQRALIKSLAAKALQGDIRAMATLLSLHARIAIDPSPGDNELMEIEEQKILRRYAPRLLKTLGDKK